MPMNRSMYDFERELDMATYDAIYGNRYYILQTDSIDEMAEFLLSYLLKKKVVDKD